MKSQMIGNPWLFYRQELPFNSGMAYAWILVHVKIQGMRSKWFYWPERRGKACGH
jgi:hypothetical protein